MGGRRLETTIRWRVHLTSPVDAVYRMLDTAEGRARFWAESAEERDGAISFRFAGGRAWTSPILRRDPPRLFALEYLAGSVATFDLADDGSGGTDLTLTESCVHEREWRDNFAGWVSLLLALKAAVDFSIDIRSHDPRRTWDDGFVDV